MKLTLWLVRIGAPSAPIRQPLVPSASGPLRVEPPVEVRDAGLLRETLTATS
ncbi:hypothetical protein [Amycolatopsis sp. NPDC051372]|uniref:hypothetical protein n=1 Tax=Amycolatopsis sp. NPDC051372 TaxID=3155669 RepID=UPI003443851A